MRLLLSLALIMAMLAAAGIASQPGRLRLLHRSASLQFTLFRHDATVARDQMIEMQDGVWLAMDL